MCKAAGKSSHVQWGGGGTVHIRHQEELRSERRVGQLENSARFYELHRPFVESALTVSEQENNPLIFLIPLITEH